MMNGHGFIEINGGSVNIKFDEKQIPPTDKPGEFSHPAKRLDYITINGIEVARLQHHDTIRIHYSDDTMP